MSAQPIIGLVRWQCGCLGIQLPACRIVIEHCSDNERGFHLDTPVNAESMTELGREEGQELIHSVNRLMQEGKSLAYVRQILAPSKEVQP